MATIDTPRGDAETVTLTKIGGSSNRGNGALFRVDFVDRPRPARLADGSPSTRGDYPELMFVSASALRRMETEGRYRP